MYGFYFILVSVDLWRYILKNRHSYFSLEIESCIGEIKFKKIIDCLTIKVIKSKNTMSWNLSPKFVLIDYDSMLSFNFLDKILPNH